MASFIDRVADFGEKARLNSQIKDMEKQKVDLFTNAGTLTYNLCSSGKLQIPECEGIFNEILTLNNRIEEIRNQIEKIDEARNMAENPVIPNGIPCACGRVNVPGARFCAGCGSPITAPPEPPMPAEPEFSSTEYIPGKDEANIGVCPSCGFENKPEAIFCSNCGQSIIGGAPVSEEKADAEPETAQPEEVEAAPARVQGQCASCGFVNRPDAVFCAECGSPIN